LSKPSDVENQAGTVIEVTSNIAISVRGWAVQEMVGARARAAGPLNDSVGCPPVPRASRAR
jgi:hypothetical protein